MPSKVRLTMVVGRDPVTGAQIRKNFCAKTKKEAKRKMDEYKIMLATGKKEQQSMPFDKWADHWLSVYKDGSVKDSSYINYSSSVKKFNAFFGGTPIQSITPDNIQEFMNKNKTMSQGRLDFFKNVLKDIFDKAELNDLIEKNPAKNCKPKGKKEREKRVYTMEQVNIVKDIAKHAEHGLGTFIVLSTGVRIGELCGLKWSDFDFERNRLTVSRNIVKGAVSSLKNGDRERVIPIAKDFSDFMKSIAPEKDGFIFTKQDGSVNTTENYSQTILPKFYEELDSMSDEPLPHLRMHELRHTFGTLLFRAGNDPYTVQKILGHHDMSITMKIYVHDNIEDVENRVKFF